MLDIASNLDEQPLMSKEIAARQDIPPNFLIQIVPELRSAGLIHTVRGSGGGIYLTKKPSEISLRYIVEAIEGPIALNQCLIGEASCSRKSKCPIHEVWGLAQKQMLAVLEATTLAGLMDQSQTGKKAGKTSAATAVSAKINNEVELEV
ncbi:MAG: Rrf2 family transcriptional regulator [Actinobacteria bacterium]|nr:Rrf2 family transcriptional regulator [Actinomycetota bacterium]